MEKHKEIVEKIGKGNRDYLDDIHRRTKKSVDKCEPCYDEDSY